MKKIVMIILSICISFVGISQNDAKENTREEVRIYIEKNVLPQIKVKQKEYLKELSDNEMAKLDEIKNLVSQKRNGANKSKQTESFKRKGRSRKDYGKK